MTKGDRVFYVPDEEQLKKSEVGSKVLEGGFDPDPKLTGYRTGGLKPTVLG
ncbi:MAG: hypothetical protein V7K67_27075 [Nostoc sp.]|uniref:hypothetical protein n=1 Tax=Nostoc sp. TaxID=1180 RepID=UPI002FF0E4D6